MGFIKKSSPENIAAVAEAKSASDLLEVMKEGKTSERRRAARDLAAFPEATAELCALFGEETDSAVQHAILTSLIKINSDAVASGLAPYLRSENAALRNGAVEALQQMPDAVAAHIEELLHDENSDVRIFAIDILQALCHPDAPAWLCEIIADELHVNVCATAVDRLAEIGTPEMIPALQSLAKRFADEPFMEFAVQTAVARIEGNSRN